MDCGFYLLAILFWGGLFCFTNFLWRKIQRDIWEHKIMFLPEDEPDRPWVIWRRLVPGDFYVLAHFGTQEEAEHFLNIWLRLGVGIDG